MPSNRPRTWILHAAMWSIALGGVGAVVAAYYLHKGAALPRAPLRLTGDWILERDDEIGFVAAPNASAEFHHLDSGLRYRVSTDSARARVDRPGLEAPAQVDVVAVGCSFTWGFGVESPDTWPRQLEGLLGRSVANLGMGSYGSVQALQVIRRSAGRRPRVVVYGFIDDHLTRNVSPCARSVSPYCVPLSYVERDGRELRIRPPRAEYFALDASQAFHREVLMREARSWRDHVLAATWALRMDLRGYPASADVAYDRSPAAIEAALRFTIAEMGAASRAMGARLVVLYIPYVLPEDAGPPAIALREAAAAAGATFVDMAPTVVGHLRARPDVPLHLPRDTHPNPLAHRLIAERLADEIRTGL